MPKKHVAASNKIRERRSPTTRSYYGMEYENRVFITRGKPI